MTYQQWKASVLGKTLGDGQCVAVVVNNPQAYAEALYPGVNWTEIFKPVPAAKDLFADANSKYFTAIANDHNDPNQVPHQGDIMVFDATPSAGYADTFSNPYGHTGVCDGANSSGYTLVQQNAPAFGAPVNVTTYPWKFRPCIGWLRPVSLDIPEYYTVVSGDTLSGIAAEHSLTLAQIEALNSQVANPNLIYPGEHIRIK